MGYAQCMYGGMYGGLYAGMYGVRTGCIRGAYGGIVPFQTHLVSYGAILRAITIQRILACIHLRACCGAAPEALLQAHSGEGGLIKGVARVV